MSIVTAFGWLKASWSVSLCFLDYLVYGTLKKAVEKLMIQPLLWPLLKWFYAVWYLLSDWKQQCH